MQRHRFSEIFGNISDEAYNALRADIGHNGFLNADKWLLTTSWAEDPSAFRNAKAWERDLQTDSEKLYLT